MNRAKTTTREQMPNAANDITSSLAQLGVVHDYPKNVVIITQGDVSDSVYVVLSGRIQVYLNGPRDKKVVLGVYGAGDYVGEMELDQRTRCASVMTLETCRLSLLTGEQFWNFMSSMTGASQLIEVLVRRARLATDTIRALALTDAYERVSRYLATLAVEEDAGLVIERGFTQQDIAEHTACSREMVSRILKKLNDLGYIALERGRIRLLRPLTRPALTRVTGAR